MHALLGYLVNLLLAAPALGVKGQTLFRYAMPETCKVGVLLVESLTGEPIDHELPGYARGKMQMIVRHTNVEDALELAESAVERLTITQRREITDDEVLLAINFVRPAHQPAVYQRQGSNAFEVSVNFDVNYVRN